MELLRSQKRKRILEFLMCMVGAIIAAFAIEGFLAPNTILDGGVVGISMMVSTLTHIPLAVFTVAFNIPFVIIGGRRLGLLFIIKTAFSMAVFAVFLLIFEQLKPFTDDNLLAVCFGGVILGVGVGIVIRGGGCLDGTETVAILLNKKFNFPVGTVVLVFNVVIYVIAGLLFGWDRAMYSLLTYFITSRVLNLVEGGLEQAKAAMIITEDAKEVAERIYKQLGRTVTIMEGEGLVSGKKTVLYCVVTRLEVNTLRNIVNSIDSSSFVAISDVSEIIGTHVKKVDKATLRRRRPRMDFKITEENNHR
ncbi:MAG: YitT family protein [Parasporobacterium sp.]|nr:YitT family protein [Parasporobacterium sp.]